MDKGDWIIPTIFIIGGVAIAVTIVWMVFTYETPPQIVYLLTDGVTCERSFMTGRVGKATHEFSMCSDGFTYINPEKYRRVIKR